MLVSQYGLLFDVLAVDEDGWNRWGLVDGSAPLVAVVDPRGIVRYAGSVDAGLSAEQAARAAQVEVDQAIFVAERLLRARRNKRR
jgi:hypothetical protein